MHISYKNIFFGIVLSIIGFSFGLFSHNPEIDSWINHKKQLLPAFFGQTGVFVQSATGKTLLQSSKVQEVYGYIEKYYYGFHKKNNEKMEDDFLHALSISAGDKYTNYFSKNEAKKFTETLHGDFEGIGAVIGENIKGVQIGKIIPNSPAEKAGLKTGDIITHVDSVAIAGKTSEEAVELIRGPKGTEVKLNVIQISTLKNKEFVIQRGVVIVPTIITEKYNSIGYIDMTIFGENTTKDFIKEFNTLVNSGSKGVIIDLRNNGGGYLDTAVDVLSLFLPENTITVVTKGNTEKDNETLRTLPRTKNNTTIPIILLVNSMSASASEIVAGALQDHKRALIVGEKTYGKGSVQTPFELSDGSLIKITTAKWFTPNDRSIDEKGIEPDILVGFEPEDYTKKYDRQLENAKKLLQAQIDKKFTIDELKTQSKDILSH